MTALQPPRLQLVEMAGGFGTLFWAAYQYLLIVYSGSTPGLRLAGWNLRVSTELPRVAGYGAGACWHRFCRQLLSLWDTPGFFSTKTLCAGTIALHTRI